MRRKKIIGAVLIAAGLALAAAVYFEVKKTVTLSGPGFGSTASYSAPFTGHGPLVVLAGIVSAVSFLAGLYLVSPERNK